MKYIIKYRALKSPELHEIMMEGTKCGVECKINLLHCQNKLKGCTASDFLKIECISEV